MIRRTLLCAIILVLATFVPVAALAADGPSPPPELAPDLADGVELAPLAWWELGDASGDWTLIFERLTLPAYGSTSLRAAAGPELLYVEQGYAVVVDDYVGEIAYGPGEFHTVEPDALVGLRSDEADDATLLRVALASPGAETGFDADLQFGLDSVETLPPSPILFIAELTLTGLQEPDPERYSAQDGPLALVVDEGSLVIGSPDGAEEKAAAGDCLVFPPDAGHQEWNADGEPATLLLAGVLTVGSPVLEPVAADPTGESGLPAIGSC